MDFLKVADWPPEVMGSLMSGCSHHMKISNSVSERPTPNARGVRHARKRAAYPAAAPLRAPCATVSAGQR
eukprot:6213379-Pleurochrysis_carterae.AAC.3